MEIDDFLFQVEEYVTRFSSFHNTHHLLWWPTMNSSMEASMSLHFRTLWISDTHLGGKNLKSDQLYEFLRKTESDYLYLAGDIFDLWKLKKSWHWPKINDRIVQLILQKVENGTRVIYLPGNHDEMLRSYVGSEVNGIAIKNEAIHTTVTGGRFLVMHGDQFDCVVQNSKWLADLGSFLYDILLDINRIYNKYRALRKKPYFSISAYLKHRCKKAVNYMGDFEDILTQEIRKKQVDGIICGHIHRAALKTMDNFLYGNSGDWVESCTALAENANGTIGIIDWAEQMVQTETKEQADYEKDRYRDRCLAPTN